MTDTFAAGVAAPLDRASLARRAQAGDEPAFEALLAPMLARNVRFAVSLLDNEADARDLVQETCVKAWRELPRLRDPSRFDSWFSQILINGARSQLRTRRRVRVRELSSDAFPMDGHPASGAATDAEVEADAIRRAFARLDGDKRTILVLHHVDGRPVAEIADVMRIPVGTVKWRLHAARAALERALEAEDR